MKRFPIHGSSVKSVLKHIVPGRVRHLGWQSLLPRPRQLAANGGGCQSTRKIAALTFDDGPNPAATPSIVEMLARYQARATFFMLGKNVVAYPDIAREVVRAGHAIGNHTFAHPRLVGCSPMTVARELIRCQQAIREVTGVAPKVMRPPFGAQDAVAFLTARVLRYAVVGWSASGDDWNGDPAARVAERVLADIRPGGIILLHDSLEPTDQTEWRPEHERIRNRAPTIAALPQIIEPLQRQGYEFVTLPELFQAGPPSRQTWFA